MLANLAATLAPRHGYNQTALSSVRILRNETILQNVPVLYQPGAVFVLQGSKQGILDDKVYLYDEDHYLAVSVPVPFRMESAASPMRPLIAIYLEFDMQMAGDIALTLEEHLGLAGGRPKSLVSSTMTADIEDVLLRLLNALGSPADVAILGDSILRELHYRILTGPQGGAMMAALRQRGAAGRLIQSLGWLRANFAGEITVEALAKSVCMSVPTYHVHFKELTGSSPMQYVKAMRLHEARLMIARRGKTISEVSIAVGYASAAQFSHDFKRHFGRTASEEAKWMRHHLGEQHAE